jgi:Protein of unknown function (DUF2384)
MVLQPKRERERALKARRSLEEVAQLIDGLDAGAMAGLNSAARVLARRIKLDPDDLLLEALSRVLTGSRQWPQDIGIVPFLIQTMRSVAQGRKSARGRIAEPVDEAIEDASQYSPEAARIVEKLDTLDFRRSAIASFFPSGPVKVKTAARQLGMSSAQLLETAGVQSRKPRSDVSMTQLDKAAQTRLQEMLEIVSRISLWAGGKEQAVAWYRAEPIPAFGSRTAESLVKEGKAAAVRDYLDHVATGGFA